jgi:hypothetical protein
MTIKHRKSNDCAAKGAFLKLTFSFFLAFSAATLFVGFLLPVEAFARGSGKCQSMKTPSPSGGNCVGIPNCKHDEAKEDTRNINSGIRNVAQCVVNKSGKQMDMVSGYRCKAGSPGCNKGNLPFNGGADCSQHLYGNAIDFRLTGLSLDHAQSFALACGASAAVKYPCKRNNFVHMDIGSQRTWKTCGSAQPDKIIRIKAIFERVQRWRS